MKIHHGDDASIIQTGGPDRKGIAMGDREHREWTEPSEGQAERDESPKAEGTQDRETGFLFCPRCGQVVLGVAVNSFCPQCGHRFCSSCSD